METWEKRICDLLSQTSQVKDPITLSKNRENFSEVELRRGVTVD